MDAQLWNALRRASVMTSGVVWKEVGMEGEVARCWGGRILLGIGSVLLLVDFSLTLLLFYCG